ncbi:hypothetical protein TVAG_444560 [Trichomonas vaginalis G3]|uniref:E2F/DP family winged-helix DNA-binding domain-containing protein n=1 Tax=Trichomonas vaginalis (strain ATCC PRA-98 / G3) TaxID=412133 RepID=A2E2J7_TRIV3|nr:e2F-like (mammalian transcription factor) family [Trichomonas vaginalis G3]EAY13172.1 hypothetical protein TVAG_444560 [Trichomonas vaginalis G3]KAI5528283.1 e2F-like (mammalian transcription factor) family [Trichomonas vaginalis G3]|eukprot:XP_001325395.1 hypothetical protein [Trichomonas vaginalis G3]
MNFTPRESNFSATVKKIISQCKASPQEYIKVNTIAENENCEKRRLYDLFNVLCSLGLCTKTVNKMYCWSGEDNMLKTINEEYERVESLAINNDFWTIFKMPESPPIGQLALTTVIIYLFFGTNEMALKQVCLVMAQKRSKMSCLLRRLYLAAFFLEQVGVIAHSFQIGSYTLLLDYKYIISSSFSNMKERLVFPFNSIASQLHRIDDNYLHEIKYIRNQLLIQKMKATHVSILPNNGHDNDQDQIEYEPPSPVKMVEIY